MATEGDCLSLHNNCCSAEDYGEAVSALGSCSTDELPPTDENFGEPVVSHPLENQTYCCSRVDEADCGEAVVMQSSLEIIEKDLRNASVVQDQLLHSILRKNLFTEYLKRQGLDAPSKQQFKQRVPIVSYEDISSDIMRVADGDKSPILSAQPVTEFLKSSGTSGGEHKLIPKDAEAFHHEIYTFDHIAYELLQREVTDLDQGKAMYFLSARKPFVTKGGLIAQPGLTSYYKSPVFRNRTFDPVHKFTSPMEVVFCTDIFQVTYCHLLCGLIHSTEVVKAGSFFASLFVRSVRSLENCWEDLCNDIRTGELNSKITDPSIRIAVDKILKPNPNLADLVHAECSKSSWGGIIRRLWPNLKLIAVTITGSMSQYIPLIDYYTDGLQIVSMLYCSSEACIGINFNPICSPSQVSYVIAPHVAYFEFLPVDQINNSSTTELDSIPEGERAVDLKDVKVGQKYELVVTAKAGLYRYKVGDILKVEGFYHESPIVSFVSRKNVILSVHADKTDEKDLQLAVNNAHSSLPNKLLVDYTSIVDLSSQPPHYVIFWELVPHNSDLSIQQLEQCCYMMEQALSIVYQHGRMDEAIGALELRLVRKGTFEMIEAYAIMNGASASQIKIPRCIKNDEIIEILQARVYQKAYSPMSPWKEN